MWSRFNDLESTLTAMDELRRRMNQAFGEGTARTFWLEPSANTRGISMESWGYPRAGLFDAGAHLTLWAEVPGLAADSLDIQIHQGVLTVKGERKEPKLEGYSTHRQERGQVRFSRSFTLPARVDLEKTTATLKDGVLTVTLPKAAESQPRQISVKAE